MNFFEYIESVLRYCYKNFYNEPWEIQLIWICIPLFIISTLIFILTLLFLRVKRNYKTKSLIEQSV